MEIMKDTKFQEDLRGLLNTHSKETLSNTPDYVLACYLSACLQTWEICTRARDAAAGLKPVKIQTQGPKHGLRLVKDDTKK